MNKLPREAAPAPDIRTLLHDLRNLTGTDAAPRCATDAADLIERIMARMSVRDGTLREGPCNCVDDFNRSLADHNTRIVETLGFPRDGSPAFSRPTITTEKIETRKRGGPAIALPSFCPFCGTPYQGYGAPTSATSGEADHG